MESYWRAPDEPCCSRPVWSSSCNIHPCLQFFEQAWSYLHSSEKPLLECHHNLQEYWRSSSLHLFHVWQEVFGIHLQYWRIPKRFPSAFPLMSCQYSSNNPFQLRLWPQSHPCGWWPVPLHHPALFECNFFPVEIASLEEELAKVTIGGIKSKEIDSKTLESKLVEGLYFAGEVLEVAGPSGGYNLQIAFATGYLAGEEAAKSLKE